MSRIIDRSSWQALGVRPGDRLLNAKGEQIGEVVRVSKRKEVTVRTIIRGVEFDYLLSRGESYESLIEFGGCRFSREDATS